MSYNQQHFNTYQQGQQYVAPYQMAGQINQNQQFYNNHVNQQQQHDDFGDFVSSSSQNNSTQQSASTIKKYDAFNNLQGPSGFTFNESPQKPTQKQGQNQMFMNNSAPNNFNVQAQNQQNLATIHANGQYGYGNVVNQNANISNLHQHHSQQQYQVYQSQQLQQQQQQQQQFQQSQIYQHQAHHMNQSQAYQQFQQNQVQNLQNPQQINQFYAQNQAQMAQAALNNPQYQAQINLTAQLQQKHNIEDEFGDFSTASTVQNIHQMQGSFNQNGQIAQQAISQYQHHQNFQHQGYSNQGQNIQQNLVNMTQSAQTFQEKHPQISNQFNTVQHANFQAQNNNHLHHLSQQQVNWQLTQNPNQQVQKNSDDFGDFNDAPSTQNNLNAAVQIQNQFQTMPSVPSSQNINTVQQAQIIQQQIVTNQVQQINKLTNNDDDFGDFTSHQSSQQTTTGLHNLQTINNLNALNAQNHQQNIVAPNLQQQQPKIVKQNSDEFGDFTTVQTTAQQLNGIQTVLPNTSQGVQQGLSQHFQSHTNIVQQSNQIEQQQSNINQTFQQNNLQALQNAFGSTQITQQDKDNNTKKQSDDFGDFETASGAIQNNSSSNQAQNEKVVHSQFQNSAQKSDGFGEFTDAQPQVATHVSSFNQVQQTSLPTAVHNIQNQTAQQKISDDFGDFQDTNVPIQPQNQPNNQNAQQEGFKKYNAFYELEQKAQESQPKTSVLDMPLDIIPNLQQNHQKNQDLFGDDDNQNEDDFGEFQDIKTENLIQQQTQQQQQIQNQNIRFHSDQQYNFNAQTQVNVQQANILFNSQLPTVKKSGAEIEKELIGNVISLFDDYKVDHLTDKNKMFQNQSTQQVQQQPTNLVQPQSNVQVQNKIEDEEFGEFADFQESKQQEKVVVQPIHAYELDWDSIIKQNQQVDNDLQPQDQLQDELSQQGQQESKLNPNKKNHQNDLFEDHSSQNNAKATSSIQDNNQGDHTSSQADTLTLDFERNLKVKKNQKKNDFEDDLQAELGGDDDFGDFEQSNKHQQVLNVPQNNQTIFQTQNTANNVFNNNDLLFEGFEQAPYQPQQQNNQVQNNPQQVNSQYNDQNDDDLFGDFQGNDQINQQKEPQQLQQQQQQNANQFDEFEDFEDFEDFAEAPTQQNQQGQQQQQQIQQQTHKQEPKVMDLKEFEMNTFDITALDYGESAKQKAEQQKKEQERKKQEEEERKRLQQLELEKQKQQKLNQIPQFNVGKQIYKGEYWRKVYENDERYYVDNKFYEDLIQEIDSLGLYQHFEKLIAIREGLDKIEDLEKQRKKAKNDQNYDKMYQLKQEIDEIESQKDYKAEMMSLVYQVIACEGKCFNHLIYDRIRNLENALIFVKQFQTLHDQNRDVDEAIDFMIITTTIDNNYSSYVQKLYQVQEVCQKELQQFESKMKQFHSLPTQVKQQIVSQKQFTDFIKASTQILYHGKRYSKISISLSSQSIDFDILEKIVTNNILILNKQFNTGFEQVKKNFSFTEELTQEQREKIINDIVNRESNLHLNEFICNLCLGVANDTRVHYRGKHYHNLCINIWFNKISTIIE
ncbi:hypothetical protein TTHERM_00202870 (macronuclear) [Tetrahymena thermophila SB210]|uniref:Uncharacterized protein n=1 Tax=Tetrahymena thermophila (strain SB210) TaxID=312017 RepID=Q22NF8_TETTS|nr:hypothetical protein TTHERM_00202870 [Tetrahymena thermophila SB210]EAR86827.2 hypothetical protein TTHERM_00202870 [Tetrahymena thermophila SB210]|eukprot:XP_001007072.2 hypothetical protein TTHERM_00202870 [Tetrahymena thermophila SB210]